MSGKQGCGFVLLLFFYMMLHITVSESMSTPDRHKRDDEHLNAFSGNFDACLFTAWTKASGKKKPVLSGPLRVQCKGRDRAQLCYGLNPQKPAQFAVCYNKVTLIPDFTGHIVKPNIKERGGRDDWHNEGGKFAPQKQSSVGDYEKYSQRLLYPNFNADKEQFLGRGHYTPNADFDDDNEREMTMVNTNIAPQWQLFNGINWAVVEKAVRTYATRVGRSIYVFTGTGGGIATNILNGNKILLNSRVATPRYYWKAICDPGQGSIVFWGENAVGVVSVEKVVGCNGKQQTKKKGVIYCSSLKEAAKKHKTSDFKLPPFSVNCRPDVKANFFDGTALNALE